MQMKPKTKLLRGLLMTMGLFLTALASAQTRTVEGRVLDNVSGTPLVGASVAVKGTEIGVLTNATGQFSIAVGID